MAGEFCWMDGAGEKCELKVVDGLGNVSGTGGELGERSGAGRSRLVPREGCARMTDVCLAGSDRQTVHTWVAAMVAACSMCPSWAKLLAGGDGVM